MKIVYPPVPDLPSLGAPAPVSQSPLWRIQEDYFQSLGVCAWDEQTPYFITNSVAAAQIYAELILALVRDLGPDPEGRPLTILEVGTGIGRLGFLLCRELERQRPYFAATRAQPLRLILSDIAEDNVRFWESHPSLARYAEAGWLDFACYHPVRETSVRLRRSGEVLEPGGLALPLVVLANYVFDTLPHDEFQIRFKRLQECKLELFRAREPAWSTAERTDIRDVTCHRTYRTVTPDYYPNPRWNAMLRAYLERVQLGAVTLPVGGLTSLENLQALSREGLMLLACDRAYTTSAAMAAQPQHDYDVHQGCFSHFVNFDALGRYFQSQAGLYLHTSHHSPQGVQTMVGVALGEARDLANLEFTFREHLDRQNRINAASATMALVNDQPGELQTARGLLAWLRQNLADPNAVAACGKRLLYTIGSLSPAERSDLESVLEEAWKAFYPFRGAVQLPYWVGHCYRTLGRHDRALEFFDHALACSGEAGYVHMFRAGCLEQLGRRDEARAAHQRALELDPSLADGEF